MVASKVIAAVTLAVCVNQAESHGMLTKPISRALRAATGSTNGLQFAGECPGHACEWYTQKTVSVGKATNCDPKARTMGVSCDMPGRVDWPCTPGQAVPWCAPGTAAVKSPCGVFSGGLNETSRDMLDLDGTTQATWTAGATAEISTAVIANHGGGYSFRICPADSDLSEDCFQQGHLSFASDQQVLVDQTGKKLVAFPAVRVTNGTMPMGSTWTRNPIPQEDNLPGIPGYPLSGRGPFALNIVDTVQVPANAKGHYVLSWRWDAEQTKQVWSHCSDVEIIAGEAGKPSSAAVLEPTSDKPVCVGASVGLATDDCEAWVEIYDDLGGENWPAEWSQDCSSVRLDPCGCKRIWQKNVVCTGMRDFSHITELYMLSGNLTGAFPSALTKLTELRALSLVDTRITGSLPDNWGDLKNLEMMWLDHNPTLGGPLPQSMNKLKLSVIELHRSNFSGTLPPLDYRNIADCTLNDLVFDCPLPFGAEVCGALCKPTVNF